MKKPISFFVHHQGRGHANRTMAMAEHFSKDRPVSVLTAGPEHFAKADPRIEVITLPNMIGETVPTARLFAEPTPSVMHCVPLGLPSMRRTMRTIVDHLDDRDVGLFVVDVSAEIGMLGRIVSTPTVQIRMHGDRSDIGHIGSYEACVGMIAPFDARLEQDDYPQALRAKTIYTGGLCTTRDAVPTRQAARAKLGLAEDRKVILVLTGGGGSGTPLAPLTIAARAVPDALWLVAGPVHREGHETDFANLQELGWVENVTDHIAAADVVVASAGDNTVHEIARAGSKFVVMPEWRYFAEQHRKAEALVALGAAVTAPAWPGDYRGWQQLLHAADAIDPEILRSLHDPDAARKAANWLETLCDDLWRGAVVNEAPQLKVV
ncbi:MULTISPECIES: glycosyltransferase [unclassified Rhizobium]|uniref:glycosyltransferase n=1 Tax=Rhizobium sp. PP-CC-3G-465 TaxID=2135648 RepID=UPI00104A2F91|nr:putative glycosyltransferase [Rhizobium sp. PP-F2F-G36]TCQ20132.1 putative glycosyltransferase [Rhizobium sp. PP-CC-3G-465]